MSVLWLMQGCPQVCGPCWQPSASKTSFGQRASHPGTVHAHHTQPFIRGLAARHAGPAALQVAPAALARDLQVDVVIVGAGVIGLCTALALLQADRHLSVALLDRQVPCAGATGAGQGYLWLAHRDISSPLWDLAVHSKQLWEEWLAGGSIPQLSEEAVELQPIGSMLIATDAEESAALQQRQQLLSQAGVRATWAEPGIAARLEPALAFPPEGSALLVPDDLQINGRRTAAALQAACEVHGRRFIKLFYERAQALLHGSTGRVEGVQTTARRLHAPRGVVVAAGAWSGDFLAGQLEGSQQDWAAAFKPRKGLLLEMPRPQAMPATSRGLMEMGYSKHYDSSRREAVVPAIAAAAVAAGGAYAAAQPGQGLATAAAGATAAAAAAAAAAPFATAAACSTSGSPPPTAAEITFTATTSASGSLLVGSSREFAGYDSTPDPGVVAAIMQRAIEFLPGLSHVRQADISVRAGPRPYATRGLPLVGPVPEVEGLYIAAGHEGSGLTLAPATAELVCHHLLGDPTALTADVVRAMRP